MVGSKKKRIRGRKAPEGNRQDFLVHLDPQLIKSLKLAALESEAVMTASVVLETALVEWLERGKATTDKDESGNEKRQFLAKISVKVIKEIKAAAKKQRVTASSLVAVAVREWLARNKSRAPSSGRGQ